MESESRPNSCSYEAESEMAAASMPVTLLMACLTISRISGISMDLCSTIGFDTIRPTEPESPLSRLFPIGENEALTALGNGAAFRHSWQAAQANHYCCRDRWLERICDRSETPDISPRALGVYGQKRLNLPRAKLTVNLCYPFGLLSPKP